MLQLAAFADEISPDLPEQIRVCRENGVTHLELRGVNNLNVMDFDETLRREIRDRLRDNDMGVASIGSPIGKVKITDPWPAHFERFKRAVELAEYFESPLIRIFSYYPPAEGAPMQPYRDEVVRRMREKVQYVGGRAITLVHENEHAIYGQSGAACLDLMRAVHSPRLRSAFDFANFVLDGERPRDNWPGLKPFTSHIHIKDARFSDRKIVPAGQGDGDIAAILSDAYRSGYRGFLSLEPHLAAGGQFGGFTGPNLFKVAVDALKSICRDNGIPLAAA